MWISFKKYTALKKQVNDNTSLIRDLQMNLFCLMEPPLFKTGDKVSFVYSEHTFLVLKAVCLDKKYYFTYSYTFINQKNGQIFTKEDNALLGLIKNEFKKID